MTKILSLALAAALTAGAPVAFAAGDKAKVDAEACKKAGDKADAKMKEACAKLAAGEKKK